MKNLLAQIDLAPPGGFKGKGPLGLEGSSPTDAPTIFNRFLSSTIGLMTIIAIIWFVFIFLAGAYTLINAGGDKAAVEAGRKKIANGLTGLIVTVAAVFIIDLIGNLIGIPNILNPAELLQQIP